VSIKNDGHYFCRAGGNRPDGLNEPVTISVQGDIVLQSDSKISLRVGGSFVVIHSGGVDIKGAKINLNGGGSPGDVILPMRPVILKAAAGSGTMFVAHCPKEDK
uniref:hypothetical protein n=1 Tax=Escherichia coli TaxID=562 RepID=UPI001E2F5927